METKMIPARVIRISAEIAQQAADFAVTNSTGTVALLLVNDICVGIDTSVVIPSQRKPTFSFVDTFGVDEAAIKPATFFTNATVYEIIKNDGPITTTQIAVKLAVSGSSKSKDRVKIYQAVHALRKEGFIVRNGNDYAITTKTYTDKKKRLPAIALGKRGSREKPITVDNILEVLSTGKPMLTFDIGTKMGLKNKSKQRPKITRLIRNQMIEDGLVTMTEKPGGKSTYEISALGREKLDNVKVITTVLDGVKKKTG